MPEQELVIYNATVVTMDADSTILPRGYVMVRAGGIAAVEAGDPPATAGGERLDAEGGLVLPGLINTHTHAAMTLFRGLADDLPLMQWLESYIFPAEARMDAAFVHTGARLACAEMIRAGITCFCDMYLFAHEVARAARDCGVRAVVGEVLYDFPSPNYGPIEAGFAYTRELIETWRGDPLVSVAVQPHAPYTCRPELLREADRIARHYDVPLVMHLAETDGETRQIQERYGLRPVAHLDRLGLLHANLIADHAVWLTADEIALMAQRGVRVAHCVESNMKLASGVAPLPELLAAGVTVGLGTDGCASNNDLDLFGEMDTVAKLHKVQRLDPTVMDAATVLRLATIEGARVLGLAHRIGSLETGKRADLIVVDTRQPHLTPLYNPVSHLVYAARSADVRHTVIDGRLVMRDRRLLTIDLASLLDQARAKAALVTSWVA
ncbi:MAG: amidohydrolase [Deltaproteobacteria bacterium]|nr:amidohydrolase [Deltaproteobacteria bacterium]RLB95063.1 MAG: S-adenosylhomocysteine deaminase [Deltaproteobacteria bacterium]